jgi:hypothetical protein
MFAIYTSSGDRVLWAPIFDTMAEAETWMNGDHDWEERMEIVQLPEDD